MAWAVCCDVPVTRDKLTVSFKAHLGNPGLVQIRVAVLDGLPQEVFRSRYARSRRPVLREEIAA